MKLKNIFLGLLILFIVLTSFTIVEARREGFREEIDQSSHNYDFFEIKKDIDDEDVRISIVHRWNTPSHEYEYEEEFDDEDDILRGNGNNMRRPYVYQRVDREMSAPTGSLKAFSEYLDRNRGSHWNRYGGWGNYDYNDGWGYHYNNW